MSPQELKADNYNGLSRRNWLRKAVSAATGAMLLLFVLAGCTKELQDIIKHPGGGLGSTPGTWYNLKANYRTEEGATAVGYFRPVNARGDTWYGSEIVMDIGYHLELEVHPADELGDGWQYWKTRNAQWLSLSSSGFLYREADSTQRKAWKIVDGKLYNNYWNKDKWQDYPVGARYYSFFLPVPGYYAGVGFADEYALTNCELVPFQR
jgi:hypothetical protein